MNLKKKGEDVKIVRKKDGDDDWDEDDDDWDEDDDWDNDGDWDEDDLDNY